MSDVAPSPGAQTLPRGVLFGLGAGVIAGVAWYLVVLGTTSMTTYLIPALGIGVAYGVHKGMHRPGVPAALISVGITALTVVLALYYVERHLVLNWFTDNHDSVSIPLVPYVDWLRSVIAHAFKKGPGPSIYSGLALVAGGWFGFKGFPAHEPARQSAQEPAQER